MSAEQAIYGIWDVWFVSWAAAALWAARAAKRIPISAEAWRDLLALAGVIILFNFAAPLSPGHLGPPPLHPLWRTPAPVQWALVALTIVSLAFCWWARLHLGRLWSGFVGRKAQHRVVDTGPYRLVRHPIYTGVLAGLLSMAALKGTPAALAGLALVILALWSKARLEERFLRGELGEDAYDGYSRRTPMLVPFPPFGVAPPRA